MTFCSCSSAILYLLSWLALSGMPEPAGTFTHTWKPPSALTMSKKHKTSVYLDLKKSWHFICNHFKYNISIRSIKYILIDQVFLCTSSVIVNIQSCSVKIRPHFFYYSKKLNMFQIFILTDTVRISRHSQLIHYESIK